MRIIDKYLTESNISLNKQKIEKLISNKKSGSYNINDKSVLVTFIDDTIIFKYPSDFDDLTYILVDVSDDMKYSYQQIGMNTKKIMKFIIDTE